MFKVYGVSAEKKSQNDHEIIEDRSMTVRTLVQEDPLEDEFFEEDTRSAITEEVDHDTDIGQIAVDVLDFSDRIVIVAPIAGVDPSDVNIGLSRNILTLSGSRSEPKLYKDAKRMLVEECFYGNFSRSIILPENLGFDEIEATVEHNVITIRIPKLTLISKSITVKK